MKPYIKKQESSVSSFQKNIITRSKAQSYGKWQKWELPINKPKNKSKKPQSSFTLSSVTLSSNEEDYNQYKKNRQKLTMRNTIKQQFNNTEIVKNFCKIEQKQCQKQQQKFIQKQVQTIDNSQIKIVKIIDIMYQPPKKQNHLQNQNKQKKQDHTQDDSASLKKTNFTSDFNQSKENTNTKQRLQLKDKEEKKHLLESIKNHVKSKIKKQFNQISKKEFKPKQIECIKSNSKSRQKSTKNKQEFLKEEFEDQLDETPFNLDDMRNCKCCGKLITKLCFRCPHIYCNADNCARKKKQLLNQRMLQKMKQDKIQEHYRQREMFQQRFRVNGSPKAKQEYKFKKYQGSQEQEQSNQDSHRTNQLCQQSSQDESSEKTLMFLKKNQKKSKKQNKNQCKSSIIKRTKNESQESQNQSSNKRFLRKTRRVELYQDSGQ